MIEKAITLLQQQKFGLAKTICLHLIKKHPDHYQAHLIAGVCALHEQQTEHAIAALQTAANVAKNARDKAQALSNLSLAYHAAKETEHALHAITQAIHLQPDQPLYYCNRANLHEALGAWQAMAKDARIAYTADNSLLDAQVSLCLALRKSQQLHDAWEILNANPQIADQDWLNEWGVLQPAAAPEQDSQTLYTLINDTQLLNMAAYACEQRAYEAAHALYQQAAMRQPDNPEVQHQLAALSAEPTLKAPEAYVSNLFDAAADQFDTHMLEKLDYRVPEQLAALLAPYLHADLQTLDLGCGTGLAGMALAQRQPNLHLSGVDLSEKMLEQARNRTLYQQLICGDIEQILPSLPSSNLVIMTDLLIYIGALAPLFQAIDQHLHSEGLIAFSTENCDTHWRLSVTGRYQHSAHYIQRLSDDLGWQRLHQQDTVLRTEHSQPVLGTLWVFKKA